MVLLKTGEKNTFSPKKAKTRNINISIAGLYLGKFDPIFEDKTLHQVWAQPWQSDKLSLRRKTWKSTLQIAETYLIVLLTTSKDTNNWKTKRQHVAHLQILHTQKSNVAPVQNCILRQRMLHQKHNNKNPLNNKEQQQQLS